MGGDAVRWRRGSGTNKSTALVTFSVTRCPPRGESGKGRDRAPRRDRVGRHGAARRAPVHVERRTIITTNNKATLLTQNAKISAGITKNLAAMATITLNGTPYTPAQLIAIYTADSAAITATEAAHKALAQCVLNESSTHAVTAKVTSALRSFLIGYYGAEAVAIIGDFGLTAPKSAATSVATKALAAAKATATKKARGVRGSVQKLDVTGGVTGAVLTESGAGAKVAPSTPASGAPTEAPAAPAPAAAPPAATPVTPVKAGS